MNVIMELKTKIYFNMLLRKMIKRNKERTKHKKSKIQQINSNY